MATAASSGVALSPVNPWPADGLEFVPACPVCGGTERELAHRGLRDRVFFCAPGEWNLFRCLSCGPGYLDPRPNAATVGLAYSQYFTHHSAASVVEPPRSAWRRHRTAQRNAYLNARYGYQLSPASREPRGLSTERRQRFDKQVAYLPYPGKGARLLDVGCGNGRFLMQMRATGWEVAGVEPDPKAAAAANAAGLNVKIGLLEAGTQPDAAFDAITMNHVIEHLHHPAETLRQCRRVLKPGGVISIATPNFAARGHEIFGADWFPLDPPRHLVLFTPSSLQQALRAAGLESEPAIRLRLTAKDMFLQSMFIQRGGDPIRRKPGLGFADYFKTLWLARQVESATRRAPELAEEIVLLGRRAD